MSGKGSATGMTQTITRPARRRIRQDRQQVGDSKVIRGGSWGSGPEALRSADREIHLPPFRGLGAGFRWAKTL